MLSLWGSVKTGYLRLIEPVVEWFVRRGTSPNVITTWGTICTCAAGLLFASGEIVLAGWTLGVTALFDVVDGAVARRTGKATPFGAFYDSTLDRIADGFLFGGLTLFYASDSAHHSRVMVAVSLTALLATSLTSYTRARAEVLGISLKGVGLMERPERIVLLAAPPAFFGLAFNGRVLAFVVLLLAATAVITIVQRIRFVERKTAATRLIA